MTVSHYDWRADNPAPSIKPHSLVKHELLGDYLRLYVERLLKRRRGDSTLRLTLVDGFAGGGQYTDEHSAEICKGSPLIILDAIRDAAAIADPTVSGSARVDANYVFIEKDKQAFDCLDAVLHHSDYAELLGTRISLKNDTFEGQYESILSSIEKRSRSRRAIFFLDQYGYTAVPLSQIRRIFSWSDKAEVILTFATDSLIDYLTDDERCLSQLEKIGLGRLDVSVEELKEQEQDTWRETIQQWLHDKIWKNSGAAYYTPFFLYSPRAHRSYWLVHLSSHPRARDVMVGLHWKNENSFIHYGGPGLKMLGYNPEFDKRLRYVQGRFQFDGDARTRTADALREQLPDRFATYGDGIVYRDFFAGTTNEMPATEDMLKTSILEHVREGTLLIKTRSGRVRRVESNFDADDVVCRSRQKRLFLPSR